jgi:hypothetical protein
MFKKVLGLVAVVCFGLGAFAGYAYSSGRDDVEPQFHDSPKLLANAQKKLMVMTQNDARTFTNTSLSNLTADTITVPATGNYRAVVRFSGESQCAAASWCSAVITVDGVEANPKSGTDFAFDSPGGETWQSLSMDRTSDVIAGTGTAREATVSVNIAVIGGGSWRLDDWSVVSELYRVS